jgi:hypothetical protein
MAPWLGLSFIPAGTRWPQIFHRCYKRWCLTPSRGPFGRAMPHRLGYMVSLSVPPITMCSIPNWRLARARVRPACIVMLHGDSGLVDTIPDVPTRGAQIHAHMNCICMHTLREPHTTRLRSLRVPVRLTGPSKTQMVACTQCVRNAQAVVCRSSTSQRLFFRGQHHASRHKHARTKRVAYTLLSKTLLVKDLPAMIILFVLLSLTVQAKFLRNSILCTPMHQQWPLCFERNGLLWYDIGRSIHMRCCFHTLCMHHGCTGGIINTRACLQGRAREQHRTKPL